LQAADSIGFTGWLAALDDFRNWLIREAACGRAQRESRCFAIISPTCIIIVGK
jgi:hypothetical protein